MTFSLESAPPWTKGRLRKLGEALAAGVAPPDGCPAYGAVIDWHGQLAEAISVEIARDWESCSLEHFDVSARAKTVDTLTQKLRRLSRGLDSIQDLAGVRLDGDLTLTAQTRLALEICQHFGHDPERAIKDIRKSPHAGYRAVHLWLRFPAGRAELQIRTRAQSEWANTFEALGDTVGRGIRYDEPTGDLAPEMKLLAEKLIELSAAIAGMEEDHDDQSEPAGIIARLRSYVEVAAELGIDQSVIDQVRESIHGSEQVRRSTIDLLTRIGARLRGQGGNGSDNG